MDLFRSEPRNKKTMKDQWPFLGPSLEMRKRGGPVALFRSEPRNEKTEILPIHLKFRSIYLTYQWL